MGLKFIKVSVIGRFLCLGHFLYCSLYVLVAFYICRFQRNGTSLGRRPILGRGATPPIRNCYNPASPLIARQEPEGPQFRCNRGDCKKEEDILQQQRPEFIQHQRKGGNSRWTQQLKDLTSCAKTNSENIQQRNDQSSTRLRKKKIKQKSSLRGMTSEKEQFERILMAAGFKHDPRDSSDQNLSQEINEYSDTDSFYAFWKQTTAAQTDLYLS